MKEKACPLKMGTGKLCYEKLIIRFHRKKTDNLFGIHLLTSVASVD